MTDSRKLGHQIWMSFCYLWAVAIVVGVVLLLRSDDSITPTATDFVVILGVALAPMLGPLLLKRLYQHLTRSADGTPAGEPTREDEE